MRISTPTSRHGQVCALLLTLLPLYYVSYRLRSIHTWSPFTQTATLAFNKTDFQTAWLATDLLQPFNPSAIEAYCNTTTWHPNLIFNLPNANGGVGNIRAEHLDFLFYAIEAGASIILPGMAVRKEEDLVDVWGAGHAGFRNMFDEEWFTQAMGAACPQMGIYKAPADDEGWESIGRKVDGVYDPRVPKARRHTTREAWVEQTHAWLSDHNASIDSLAGQDLPIIVDVERTMWETDTRSLPPSFRRNLGMLLRIRPDVRQFAASAMSNLASNYSLRFPPSDPLHEQAFYGAHLRTESDTVAVGWMSPAEDFGLSSATELGLNFSAQTDVYMSHATQHNLSIIFAASGNASEIEKFKEKALLNDTPLTVLSKWDLLTPFESAELRRMHWDQQALVDLEILKRCSVFGGMAKSSFAFTIAMARTGFMEGEGQVMDPWDFKRREEAAKEGGGVPVAFDNGWNRIWGRNEACETRVPRGGWP